MEYNHQSNFDGKIKSKINLLLKYIHQSNFDGKIRSNINLLLEYNHQSNFDGKIRSKIDLLLEYNHQSNFDGKIRCSSLVELDQLSWIFILTLSMVSFNLVCTKFKLIYCLRPLL
jgi:hypothetical protein